MKFFNYIIFAIRDFLKFFIIYMPGGLGNKLRYLFYKHRLKKCGSNVIIDVGVILSGEELISVGNNVHIDKYCIINTGKKIVGNVKRKTNKMFYGEEGEIIIGDNVHIAQFSILMGFGGINIRNNCVLSANNKVYSLSNIPNDHKDKSLVISLMPYEKAPFIIAPVVIDENSWLGLNCIVMPGVYIGKNSFVQSNSLLIGKFPENSYIAGHLAKRINQRFVSKK